MNRRKLLLIAGPCVVENEKIAFQTADYLKNLSIKLDVELIYKSSYKKANRSKISSFSGINQEEAFSILSKVKSEFDLSILTDIHEPPEAQLAAEVADYLQIPAFLCRQTELLLAAGRTGKTVNVKKGQFLSPQSMSFAVEKVRSTGNNKVWLTERGTMFGYNDLIVDFRSIPIMKEIGVPVIFDTTHSLQMPNQSSGVTGGNPQWIIPMAKSGLIWGADGIFVETHPDPSSALSDGANMLPMHLMEKLIEELKSVWNG
jgi:2-dehydro-3-deoxyphosphooctonate aldolase (KDO 8-P synthase)